MGRESLRKEGKIVTDILEKKSLEVSPKKTVPKDVTESVQNVIVYLRVRIRKWVIQGVMC